MRTLLGVFFALWAYHGNAQEPFMIFEDTVNSESIIKFSSFNTYSSNKFNNEFMDKFLFGGEITTELKDNNASRLSNRNVLGAEFEQRIDNYSPGINIFKKESLGLMLSFSDNHFASFNITEDLYNTAMYGNSPYIGDTMNFDFSTAQYLHFQKFGLGFYNEYNMSSIQINYVMGSRTVKAALSEAWMYTDPNVDSIDVFANGNAFMTDRFFPYWAFQGSGFAIDINYNFVFEGKVKNRQIINFKINNLGMIFWNRNTQKYSISSNATYSGFDIQDLMNQDSTTNNGVDWMDTLGISQSTGFQVDVLPIELVVQKLPDQGIDAKWQAIYGFKAIMIPEYFPYLFGGAYFRATDNFSMSSRLSYGGFAGLRWGLNMNYWIKDKAYFSLGSFDLIGLFSKKIGYGRGINFSMYFKV
ncbi:MAG: hypothetical protein HUJ25_01230 [Crocinitomicaceae bacterium]|nr:hypothetical protein [Crocinitomicaceae bacterium]